MEGVAAVLIIFILFAWIGPALLCAVVAGNKNRSAAGWLICGLFFGLLAFLILLCLPKGEPTYRAPRLSSPPSKDPFSNR
jgi:hypothetical protein